LRTNTDNTGKAAEPARVYLAGFVISDGKQYRNGYCFPSLYERKRKMV